MSTIKTGKIPTSATTADCARLWSTLTTEYITQLRIEVRIVVDPNGETWLSVEVIDDSLASIDGAACVNVWASREFRNGLYLISVSQLFDLLIDAYRKIDAFFSLGAPSAPTLRRK